MMKPTVFERRLDEALRDHAGWTKPHPPEFRGQIMYQDFQDYMRGPGIGYVKEHGSIGVSYPALIELLDPDSVVKGHLYTPNFTIMRLKLRDTEGFGFFERQGDNDYVTKGSLILRKDGEWSWDEDNTEKFPRGTNIHYLLWAGIGNYINAYLGTEIHILGKKNRVIGKVSKSGNVINELVPDVVYRIIDNKEHIYRGTPKPTGSTRRPPAHRVLVNAHYRKLPDGWIGHDPWGMELDGRTHVKEHWKYEDNPDVPIVYVKKQLRQ